MSTNVLQHRTANSKQKRYWAPSGTAKVSHPVTGSSTLFKENFWDLSFLAGRLRGWSKLLDFELLHAAGLPRESVLQLKTLCYLILFHPGEALPSAAVFIGKFYMLRKFAFYADKVGKTIFEAAEDAALIEDFIIAEPNSGLRLFYALTKIRAANTSFNVDVPFREVHPLVRKIGKQKQDASAQTPVIPTRIYGAILSNLITELTIAEEVVDELIAKLAVGAPFGQNCSSKVSEYISLLGYQASHVTLEGGAISNVYAICQAVIAAHTGMRLVETELLPLNSIENFEHGGTVHYCINGFTTKHNKGVKKPCSWVTNDLGARAARLGDKLATAIHAMNETDVSNRDIKSYPILFPAHGIGPKAVYAANNASSIITVRDGLFERIVPTIEAADIEELKHIDPHRDWESEEDYQVGRPWPLTMRQFRRSLAVYAHRSGVVSLPSLKAQLKHLTREMTMYYARGTTFAKFFGVDTDHFAAEWNAAKGISEYLGYSMQVLFSADRQFGGAVAWANSKAVLNSPVSVHSREHAIRMFERGEIAYQETAIGGCTAVGECKSNPLKPIPYECLKDDCKDLAGNLPKLRVALKAQEKVVSNLAAQDKNSVGYRIERENLKILRDAVKRVEGKEK